MYRYVCIYISIIIYSYNYNQRGLAFERDLEAVMCCLGGRRGKWKVKTLLQSQKVKEIIKN